MDEYKAVASQMPPVLQGPFPINFTGETEHTKADGQLKYDSGHGVFQYLGHVKVGVFPRLTAEGYIRSICYEESNKKIVITKENFETVDGVAIPAGINIKDMEMKRVRTAAAPTQGASGASE